MWQTKPQWRGEGASLPEDDSERKTKVETTMKNEEETVNSRKYNWLSANFQDDYNALALTIFIAQKPTRSNPPVTVYVLNQLSTYLKQASRDDKTNDRQCC